MDGPVRGVQRQTRPVSVRSVESDAMRLEVHPLTKDRWDDLVDLFNRPGGSIVRGCWCMFYRTSGSGET